MPGRLGGPPGSAAVLPESSAMHRRCVGTLESTRGPRVKKGLRTKIDPEEHGEPRKPPDRVRPHFSCGRAGKFGKLLPCPASTATISPRSAMQIYIAEGTQQTGPFDLETIKTGLRAGRYQPTQLAWYEGAAGWEPISKLPGMEAAVAPPPPLPPIPPAPPPYSPAPSAYPPGTYATPPPPAFIPVVSAPYVPGPGTGPPKKSIWATIGGACLAALAVLFGLARIARIFLPHDSYSSSHSYASTPTPGPTSTPSTFFHPSPPASGTQRFTADRSKYTGDLAEHFVAFSFDYPDGWTLKEDVDDCYVTLKHFIRQPKGKNVQVEFASFSYAYNQPGHPLSTTLGTTGPQLLDMMVSPMLKEAPSATRTPARGGRFGKYASEEIFVTDRMNDKTGIYSRLAVVAQGNGSTDGLGVNFISTELAGSKNADSVGEGGGLRTIRDSFRFGP